MEDRRRSSFNSPSAQSRSYRAAELGSRELLVAYLEAIDGISDPSCHAALVIVGCSGYASLPQSVLDEAFDLAGSIVVDHCRTDDLACRYTNDSFAIVLTSVSAGHAASVAERYQDAISEFDWDSSYPGLRVNVRVSALSFQADVSARSQLDHAFHELRALAEEGLKDSFYL